MARWTEAQVLAAAPDTSSVAAARKLAKPGPWTETGANEILVWGSCQGSGKNPYQVSIDLEGPAYRCSCPSRKFPCKHALALLLLWAGGLVGEGAEAAGFAQEWADKRATRSEARTARAEAPADPEAQARRLAERIARMDAGVDDLILWLTDLVRAGLVTARTQPYAFWDRAAARLVDAQLPGLADRVRELATHAAGEAWADDLLRHLGRLWLLAQAWRRRDELPAPLAADLRAAVGWSTQREQLSDGETLTDTWQVLGAFRTTDGPLQQQRTWVRADGGPVGLILETAGPGQALGIPQLAGARLAGTAAWYPGNAPARLYFPEPPTPVEPATDAGPAVTVAEARAQVATALAGVPWRDRFPVTLAAARFRHDPQAVVDAAGDAFALTADTNLILLLALTGGHPHDVFGELEAGRFRPLTLALDGKTVAL